MPTNPTEAYLNLGPEEPKVPDVTQTDTFKYAHLGLDTDPWRRYSTLSDPEKQKLVEQSVPLWLRVMDSALQHAPALPAAESQAMTAMGMARGPRRPRGGKVTVTPGPEGQEPTPIRERQRRTFLSPEELNNLASRAAAGDQAANEQLLREMDRPLRALANRYGSFTRGAGTRSEIEPSVSNKDLLQQALEGLTNYTKGYNPEQHGDFLPYVRQNTNRDLQRYATKMRKPVSGVGEETPRERELWREIDSFSKKHGYEPSDDFLAIKLKNKAYTRDEINQIRGAKRPLAGRSLEAEGSEEGSAMQRLADQLTEGTERQPAKARIARPAEPVAPENPLDALLAKEANKEQIQRLERALTTLSEEERRVLTLEHSGLPIDERVAASGLSKRTYQRRAKDAMDNLKEIIRGRQEGQGPKSVGAAAYEDPAKYVDQVVNLYRRFVNRGGPDKEPDPNIVRQLQNPRQSSGRVGGEDAGESSWRAEHSPNWTREPADAIEYNARSHSQIGMGNPAWDTETLGGGNMVRIPGFLASLEQGTTPRAPTPIMWFKEKVDGPAIPPKWRKPDSAGAMAADEGKIRRQNEVEDRGLALPSHEPKYQTAMRRRSNERTARLNASNARWGIPPISEETSGADFTPQSSTQRGLNTGMGKMKDADRARTERDTINAMLSSEEPPAYQPWPQGFKGKEVTDFRDTKTGSNTTLFSAPGTRPSINEVQAAIDAVRDRFQKPRGSLTADPEPKEFSYRGKRGKAIGFTEPNDPTQPWSDMGRFRGKDNSEDLLNKLREKFDVLNQEHKTKWMQRENDPAIKALMEWSRSRRRNRPQSVGAAANDNQMPLDEDQRRNLAGVNAIGAMFSGGASWPDRGPNVNPDQLRTRMLKLNPAELKQQVNTRRDTLARGGQERASFGIPYNRDDAFYAFLQALIRLNMGAEPR